MPSHTPHLIYISNYVFFCRVYNIHKHEDCNGSDGGCLEDCQIRFLAWTMEHPGKTEVQVSEKGKVTAVYMPEGQSLRLEA